MAYMINLKGELVMSIELNKHLYELLKIGLIKEELFRDKDIDELLNLRDEERFDKKWMEVYSYIESFKSEIQNKKIIDDIRKEAFIKANSLSKSSDLAGYVSDDFELISEALEIGYNNKWLNGLFSCYLSGIFPCGEINSIEEHIADQITNYLNNMT